MKYVIEIEIPSDHSIPHIYGVSSIKPSTWASMKPEDQIKEAVGRCLGIPEEVKVKKAKGKP